MAIGLAESIVERGCVEQQHLGDTFRRNFLREPWRGYAGGPPTIFAVVENHGLTYKEAARSLFRGKGSFVNGDLAWVEKLENMGYVRNLALKLAEISTGHGAPGRGSFRFL